MFYPFFLSVIIFIIFFLFLSLFYNFMLWGGVRLRGYFGGPAPLGGCPLTDKRFSFPLSLFSLFSCFYLLLLSTSVKFSPLPFSVTLWCADIALQSVKPPKKICSTLVHTWAYNMAKISSRLFYIYRNWCYLWVDLSRWMRSVSYGLGADLSLPPLPFGDDRYLNLSSQKWPTGRNLGGNDALVPGPEVLLCWCLVCACAGSL